MKSSIITRDGENISVIIKGAQNAAGTVIFSAALGVKKEFYSGMANYFNLLGYNTLQFDYRGIGQSAGIVNDKNCNLKNWGKQDLTAVIDQAEILFGQIPIYLIGHSVAGQIFPFAENKEKVSRAYFIASQTAAYQYWSGWEKVKVRFFWKVALPLMIGLKGYLPGFVYGGKYPLHKNIATQWARWAKSEDGAVEVELEGPIAYAGITADVKFLSFEDDRTLAPKSAVKKLFDSYGSANKEHLHIFPRDLGYPFIGHFNFFRKRMEKHWLDIDEWFRKGKLTTI